MAKISNGVVSNAQETVLLDETVVCEALWRLYHTEIDLTPLIADILTAARAPSSPTGTSTADAVVDRSLPSDRSAGSMLVPDQGGGRVLLADSLSSAGMEQQEEQLEWEQTTDHRSGCGPCTMSQKDAAAFWRLRKPVAMCAALVSRAVMVP